MVHSRWFDPASSDEETIGKDGMVTMLNELSRYAEVTEFTVEVCEKDGEPPFRHPRCGRAGRVG